ncbi:MAG: hypothetical protein ACXWVU_04890 [Sulfuricurvum sp.]
MEKNASLYLLKILLSLTVVSVHVGFLKGFSTDINYLFTQGFFRIAGGIFFIISGFYFKQLIVTKKPIFPWFKHLFTFANSSHKRNSESHWR